MTGKRKSPKLYFVAFAALTAGYLIACSLINFFGFTRFCTGDMYEDTVVARLMWEQKTAFPSNWVFGNQFYVIATPNLAALFYGATGRMNLSMGLATTVMTLLMLYSFWWMVRPAVSRGAALTGEMVLLAAVTGPYIVNTTEGQIFYLMASYYACYAITLFITLGGYIRLCGEGAERRMLLRLSALPMLLSFAAGMQSLRQTAVMTAPLLAYSVLRVLWAAWRDRIGLPVVLRKERYPLYYTGLITLSNLAGLIAIRLLAPPQVTIYGSVSRLRPEQLGEHLATCFRALRSITGLKYLVPGSRAPVPALCAVLLVGVAVLSLAPLRDAAAGLRTLQGFLLLSLLAVLVSSLVLDLALRNIYLFAWYPLAAVCAMLLFDALEGGRRTALAVVLCFLAAVNLAFDYGPCVRDAVLGEPLAKQLLCRQIETSGYELLYGDWSVTAEIAACSDGGVVAGAWFGEPFRILSYINSTDVYEPEDNERAVYLLLPGERETAERLAAEMGAVLTPVYDDGSRALFESSRQLMHP